jgi:hypothetical protein
MQDAIFAKLSYQKGIKRSIICLFKNNDCLITYISILILLIPPTLFII